MGCGCGRKRVNRAQRIKRQTEKAIKARRKKLQATAVRISSVSPLTSNSSACLSCIESKQSPDEIKKGIKICHKTNRLIRNIVKDPRFVCPLGKWNKSK